MVVTLYLIGCVLAQGPPSDRTGVPVQGGERLLAPRFSKSEELVYHGTYDEENVGDRVRFCRSYRIDSRMFVLETPPTGADVAVLTVLKPRESRPGSVPAGISSEPTATSARLEFVRVDLQGHVSGEPGVNLVAPLDGPPTIECGAFVEFPSSRAVNEGVWAVAEPGRPPRTWHRAGNEMVNGTNCVKLVGEQQSEDWDKPRADRAAWRRTDTVWMATRLGVASRVERVVERRDPAMRDPSHKHVVRYELDSSLQYPGQLSEERRQEITRAKAFSDAAAPLLSTPTNYGPQLTALLSRISLHLDHQPATPYRDAILQVRRQVEMARRGETPAGLADQEADRSSVATIGQAAPDFIATDLTNSGSTTQRLRNWLGRPMLLVFFTPQSPTSAELLRFARDIRVRFKGHVSVLGLSVSDDAKAVRKQQADLDLGFPLLSGSALRISYEVETTPKLVLIDASGIVRGSYLGWGRETPDEIMVELRRWLQQR
jgi:peroxiredoxin